MNQVFVYYLDVSPLYELMHTGIAKVTKEIARYCMLRNDVYFFCNDNLIDKAHVAQAIALSSGIPFHIESNKKYKSIYGTFESGVTSIGIFPNLLTVDYFDRNIQIVHDLIYLTSPNFHTGDTTSLYSISLFENIDLFDLMVCVSNYTASDLLAYSGIDSSRVITLPLGSDDDFQYKNYSEKINDKYILILGTIEPRKGVSQVLEMLSEAGGSNVHYFTPNISDSFESEFLSLFDDRMYLIDFKQPKNDLSRSKINSNWKKFGDDLFSKIKLNLF